MVRRAPSAATDDSLKENSGAPLKSQRVKDDKAKATRGRNARAARVETDEEEEDATQTRDGATNGQEEVLDASPDDEEVAVDGAGSSKGRKRARANTQGDARPSSSDSQDKVKAEPKTLPRDEDGCVLHDSLAMITPFIGFPRQIRPRLHCSHTAAQLRHV